MLLTNLWVNSAIASVSGEVFAVICRWSGNCHLTESSSATPQLQQDEDKELDAW